MSKREKRWVEALKTALDFIPCWVSVLERLPEDGVDVLCGLCDDTGRRCATVGCYISNLKLWHLDAGWAYSRHVTHWMPLPELPED